MPAATSLGRSQSDRGPAGRSGAPPPDCCIAVGGRLRATGVRAAWCQGSWIKSIAGSIRRAKRLVNQFLEGGRNASAFVLGLLHQDVEHVQFRIDPEVSATTAIPLEFADRTWRRRFGIAWFGAHREAITEAKAIPRKIEIIPCNPGIRPDMVGRHRLECPCAKVASAAVLPAVENHLGKTRIVDCGRDQSSAAGLPFRMCATFSLRAFQDDIAGQWLRHPRMFVGAVENEFGSRHAKRIEDMLLFKLIQRLPGYDFNDAADHVG